MTKQCFLIVFLLTITLGLPTPSQAADASGRTFQAGAAIADITPPLGELVVGGFAPFPAKQIHDPLHARSLVLDDGQRKIALVICDTLYIPRDICDEARREVAEKTPLAADHVLIAGTHTHSATRSSSKTYSPILVAGIVKSVQSALKNLEPARIGWSSVDEPREVFNRRWYVTDPKLRRNPFGGIDTVRMNPPRGNAALVRPAGPVDPEVSFISVQSREGRPIALLANYSLHYVGGVNKGDVSADYFAIFSNRIGEMLTAGKKSDDHPPFVGMLSNGTSGDVNNINFRERSPKRYERYEKMTEVAEHVAERVHSAYDNVTYHDWVPVAAAMKDLSLKVRKPDQKMQDYIRQLAKKPKDAEPFHRYETNYAERVTNLLNGPDTYEIPLQAVRIGDLGIGAIPFEVFTEIGLEIKEQTPFKDGFTIELANGAYGYLPTPAQHKLGGYETWMGTNRVQLDASEHITKVVLELMQDLKTEPK